MAAREHKEPCHNISSLFSLPGLKEREKNTPLQVSAFTALFHSGDPIKPQCISLGYESWPPRTFGQ